MLEQKEYSLQVQQPGDTNKAIFSSPQQEGFKCGDLREMSRCR